MEKEKKSLTGIRIRTANIGMMAVSCVFYIFLILVTFHASQRYNIMISAMEDYIGCEGNAGLVRDGSDYLTEQVRLYAVTMDRECMDAYFEEAYTVRRRDTALEQMKDYHISSEDYGYLEQALENSNRLMEREIYAMKLISVAQGYDMDSLPADVREMELKEADAALDREEMIEKAQDMVFGDVYRQEKESINGNVAYFLDAIVEDTLQNQRDSVLNLKRTMTEQRILITILFIENILTFFLIIILVIKPLKIYIKNIEGQKKLSVSGSYEFKYLALTYNDIYELNATNEAMLSYRAEHDALTGIMNRGAFDRLQVFLRDKDGYLGLMIIDVDKFKLVNDGYGHEMGDRVLKMVAKLLEENFRATDYPARIGGDEFAVILTDAMPKIQEVIAEKVRFMNEVLQNPTDDLPKVSLSVGVAFSEHGFDEDLYKKADAAHYEVKENGRCGCRFYENMQTDKRADENP